MRAADTAVRTAGTAVRAADTAVQAAGTAVQAADIAVQAAADRPAESSVQQAADNCSVRSCLYLPETFLNNSTILGRSQ